MDDSEQVAVYTGEGLENAYELFGWCFQKFFPDLESKIHILDLGCGTAGISLCLAKLLAGCSVDGVDGADAMLHAGREAVQQANLAHRVNLFYGKLPAPLELPHSHYGAIVSNSFLHHLTDPMVLWNALKMYGEGDAAILVVDLIRPSSVDDAQDVIEKYMSEAQPLLREDMLHSLLAAFTLEEVASQLQTSGLEKNLRLKRVSPFQFAAYGRLPEAA